MPIYKPSELLHFLEDLKLIPKKGLSQNFLIDGNIIKKIIATAQVKPDDLVLEIGPGPGSLTEGLLYSGANVIAVEKDAILAKALERFDPLQNQLKVFCADILDFPIVEVLKNHLKRGQRAKIIANLPYHITTPIIGSLVHLNEFVSSITVMVQDEVARRFTAIPGNKE